MAVEVGDGYIEVGASTKKFRNDLKVLKAIARSLGNDIANGVTKPMQGRINKATKKVQGAFAKMGKRIRDEMVGTALVVGQQMNRIRNNITSRVQPALANLQAAAKKAFSSVRHGAINLGLRGSAAIRNFGKSMLEANPAITSMAAYIKRGLTTVRNDTRILLGLASREFAKFRLKVTETRERISNAIGGLIQRNSKARFLANTVLLTRQFGRVLLSGTRVGVERAGAAIAKWASKIGPTVAPRMRKAASTIGNTFSRGMNRAFSRLPRSVGKSLGKVFAVTKSSSSRIAKSTSNITRAVRAIPIKAKGPLKLFTGMMQKAARSIGNSWKRMDSTVRLVIISILVAGGPLAAVMSGLSAAAVGLAASLSGVVAAGAALGGVIPGLVYGLALAKKGLEDLEKFSPKAQGALNDLKKTFNEVDLPAFMAQWTPSLERFFSTLSESLRLDTLAASLGKSFGTITDAFSDTIDGDAFKGFVDALEGPLSVTLGNLGSALAPIAEAFMSFFTAAAPFALQFSQIILDWANNLAEVWSTVGESVEFQKFMTLALDAAQNLGVLFGNIKSALGTIFEAGIGPGNIFLGMLINLTQTFDTWLKSAEGQTALADFFDNLITVMPPLFDLIGALGTALADLVTPETMAQVGGFLGALSDIMPVLSNLIGLIANARVIEVLGKAIEGIGAVLDAATPGLTIFMETLAEGLLDGIESIMPVLGDFGALIGDLFAALSPLIEPLLSVASTLLELLMPAFEALIPVVTALVGALAPFLSQLAVALLPILQPIIDLFIVVADVVAQLIVAFMPLLPVIIQLLQIALLPMTIALQVLTPVIQLVAAALVPVIEFVSKLIGGFAEWVSGSDAAKRGMDVINNTLDSFRNAMSTARDWIQNVMDKFREWFNNIDFAQWFQDGWDKVKTGLDTAGQWISDLIDDIGEWFSGVGETISAPFISAFQSIKSWWNNNIAGFGFTTPDWLPFGAGGKRFEIPYLASGGILDRPTLNIAGEAGREAMVPLDRPLSQVSPDVRWLSAIAQGKAAPPATPAPAGAGVVVQSGAIVVQSNASDPEMVAGSVLDRLVAQAR